MAERNILRIVVDGNVVAEATLSVYDQGKAWSAFVASFPSFANTIIGDFFEAVRVGCMSEVPEGTETGLTLNVDTRPRPQLVMPSQGEIERLVASG